MNPLKRLASQLSCPWPAIEKAGQQAAETKDRLKKLVNENGEKLVSEDTSIVVFGSLARKEWTCGSDLDWTLVVDGQADYKHPRTVQSIRKKLLEGGFGPPGREQVFGGLAFSHDLVHQIGGQDDTNQNLTRRTLLLLESDVIGKREAYDRIVRNALYRYLEGQRTILADDGKRYRVPRFLLNDIVRFWRTMAVDFAQKQRDRESEGWGLRNAKLRMSRKLIFASGLVLCFNCALHPAFRFSESSGSPAELMAHLRNYIGLTPLERLADALTSYKISDATAKNLMDAYDSFLGILDDPDKRNRLKSLAPDRAVSDPLFRQVKEMGDSFQNSLIGLFFDEPSGLSELMKEYGIF